MQQIIQKINKLRQQSGNEQLNYLKGISKESVLKEILEYTYDPDRMYKIDTGKYDSVIIKQGLIKRRLKDFFTLSDWKKFTELLDEFVEKRACNENDVRVIKYFITGFQDLEVQNFLKMVLFKDLRLNLGIKKLQMVFRDFCNKPEVQLADNYKGEVFTNGYYSRKFDGKRMYIMDGIAYSRSNKPCKVEPIKHILDQLNELLAESVFDGEILYFGEKGQEDFQKGISLTASDDRLKDCDNLYYVIFDALNKWDFLNKETQVPFTMIYDLLLDMFDAKPSTRFGYSVLDTKFPNILIARQCMDSNDLEQLRKINNWEGLMYRDGDKPYQFKRTKSLLKIKAMQDGEFKIHSISLGSGKNEGRLGALNIIYKHSLVGVGSGFTDEDRDIITANSKIFLDDKFVEDFSVKVQYFEETTDANGNPSLRFPVFVCFRNNKTCEEFTPLQILEFCREGAK